MKQQQQQVFRYISTLSQQLQTMTAALETWPCSVKDCRRQNWTSTEGRTMFPVLGVMAGSYGLLACCGSGLQQERQFTQFCL